jgi:hypothetical protein
MDHTEMLTSQWETPLKPEQGEKQANQQWIADVIHQGNFRHNVAFHFCIVSLAKHEKAAPQRRPPKRGRHFEPVIVACVLECAGVPALLECPDPGHKIVEWH